MERKPPNIGEDYYGDAEELARRVRHLVAVMRSIIARSAGARSGEVQDYAAHLDGRINAFARTQTLLLLGRSERLDLEDLLREELLTQAAPDEQFTLAGPAIELPMRVGEVLTLAFHELATNANKFGALAADSGRLRVEWTLDAKAGVVALDWRESGIETPQRTYDGFGLELITRQTPYEIGGAVDLAFTEDGLNCSMRFPVGAQPKEDAGA